MNKCQDAFHWGKTILTIFKTQAASPFFLLLLLALSACTPQPAPTPQPTRRPSEEGRHTAYLPTWLIRSGCTFAPGKSLAWNREADYPQAARQVCADGGAPYLNWDTKPRTNSFLEHTPMLWGGRTDDFYRDIPPDFSGLVAGPNEPDRIDQSGRYFCPAGNCGPAPGLVAAVMREVELQRPGIRWIAPSWSNAQSDCRKQAEWWHEYIRQGGKASRVKAWGYHIYPDWRGMSAAEKVKECYQTLEAAGIPYRPMWVTEIGQTVCNEAGAAELRAWVEQLMADDRVSVIMGYAPFAGEQWCPFFDESFRLTAVGRAFREAGIGQ